MTENKKEIKKIKKSDFALSAESLYFADETVDDLELDGLMIIQKKDGYKFSTDSVLLANFAKTKKTDTLIDLCSGSGVVAIICSHKNQTNRTVMVEIQKEISNMAARTVKLNGIKNIEALCTDLSKAHEVLGLECADVITVNPPYNNVGETAKLDEIALSTHEISMNIITLANECFKLLKFGGKLFMVHRADRLVDVIFALRSNNLEPKRIRFVYPKKNREPNLILIEAKKGAKSGIKIENPLILLNDDGTETEELKMIYNR